MQLESKKLLEDIRQAAEIIHKCTTDRSLQHYSEDVIIRSAVERQFEIIGEAISRLGKRDPGTAARIGDYRQIIAFRNILIHGYDMVEDAVVWDVIQDDLPRLHEQVQALLAERTGRD